MHPLERQDALAQVIAQAVDGPMVWEDMSLDYILEYRAGAAAALAWLRAQVLAAFERPPVWGPNENGDLMLDMSLDGFLADLRSALDGGES